MKIDDSLEIISRNAKFKLNSAGDTVMELSGRDGSPLLTMARVNIDNFDGAYALPEKLRCHQSHDELSAEFESIGVIPFGCEYRVKRQWTLFDGCAILNCDIAADNGGTVRKLFLEPLNFYFTPAKVEYLIYGAEKMVSVIPEKEGIIWQGSETMLMLRAYADNGEAVEFYAGDDIWRHRAAQHIANARNETVLRMQDGKLVLERMIFDIPEEFECVKRPWKFKSLIAWQTDAAPDPELPEAPLALAEKCFTSPAARRALRKHVRSNAGKWNTLTGSFPGICCDASHLERSGSSCEHGDLAALAADYLWANRESAKLQGAMSIKSAEGIFGKSILLENMKHPLNVLK